MSMANIEESTESPLYLLCGQNSEMVTHVSWHAGSTSEDEIKLQ